MPSAIQSGRVLYSRIDEVVFGKPAALAVADIAGRMGAQRAFLTVSGTLNRETDEIEDISVSPSRPDGQPPENSQLAGQWRRDVAPALSLRNPTFPGGCWVTRDRASHSVGEVGGPLTQPTKITRPP
jgi:hypothetical protein